VNLTLAWLRFEGLKVFERPGPVNTDETISILKDAPQPLEFLVVASVTGEGAIKAAQLIKNRKIICVTCPQGMFWEVNAMNADIFAQIPELRARREEWMKKQLERVPLTIPVENAAKLKEASQCGCTCAKPLRLTSSPKRSN
jgi:uncharacterized protein